MVQVLAPKRLQPEGKEETARMMNSNYVIKERGYSGSLIPSPQSLHREGSGDIGIGCARSALCNPSILLCIRMQKCRAAFWLASMKTRWLTLYNVTMQWDANLRAVI